MSAPAASEENPRAGAGRAVSAGFVIGPSDGVWQMSTSPFRPASREVVKPRSEVDAVVKFPTTRRPKADQIGTNDKGSRDPLMAARESIWVRNGFGINLKGGEILRHVTDGVNVIDGQDGSFYHLMADCDNHL